jgi:hypothetical protein
MQTPKYLMVTAVLIGAGLWGFFSPDPDEERSPTRTLTTESSGKNGSSSQNPRPTPATRKESPPVYTPEAEPGASLDPSAITEIATDDPLVKQYVNASGQTIKLIRLNPRGDIIQEITFEKDQSHTINRTYDGAGHLLREDLLVNDHLIERKNFR